jgi:hypothetical protein
MELSRPPVAAVEPLKPLVAAAAKKLYDLYG